MSDRFDASRVGAVRAEVGWPGAGGEEPGIGDGMLMDGPGGLALGSVWGQSVAGVSGRAVSHGERPSLWGSPKRAADDDPEDEVEEPDPDEDDDDDDFDDELDENEELDDEDDDLDDDDLDDLDDEFDEDLDEDLGDLEDDDEAEADEP